MNSIVSVLLQIGVCRRPRRTSGQVLRHDSHQETHTTRCFLGGGASYLGIIADTNENQKGLLQELIKQREKA